VTRRVIGPPRPKFHERRREREAFKTRKESIPLSPQRAAYMAQNRKNGAANLARRKIARFLAGDDSVRPLTASQFAAIRPGLQQQAIELGLYTPAELQDIW
jgi:hypothetical protein